MTSSSLIIHESARIASTAVLRANRGVVARDVVIGDGCVIGAEDLVLDEGVALGAGVTISSRRFQAGAGTRIDRGCRLGGIGGPARSIVFGDQCYLGDRGTILMPLFAAGDYVSIHNHVLANGYAPCSIGHNCWIGQNCVLNSTDELTIGNNVGIGAYSSVYTHAFNGELLEGCTVFNQAPVVIEDNVWIVGSYNVISPGVTLGRRSMVLTSSVVSKSVQPAHCVGGVPAVDLTAKITPFRDVQPSERIEMMRKFIAEFASQLYPDSHETVQDGFCCSRPSAEPFRILCCESAADIQPSEEELVAYVLNDTSREHLPRATIFHLVSKVYRKMRTRPEVEVIRFMNGYRARFIPDDSPLVRAADV